MLSSSQGSKASVEITPSSPPAAATDAAAGQDSPAEAEEAKEHGLEAAAPAKDEGKRTLGRRILNGLTGKNKKKGKGKRG